ncbi:hypothetical protein BGZ65_012897, partial [Modicella reniformis]
MTPNAERVEGLQVTPPPFTSHNLSSHSDVKSGSKTKLTFKDVVVLTQKKAQESEIEQRLLTSIAPAIQAPLQVSIVQAFKHGQEEQSEQLMGHLRELKGELAVITKLNTENKEPTTEIKDMATETYKLVIENKGLMIQMAKQQEEMKQLQIQALEQLSLLQTQVQAVMTQTYELHEYPIPRL